MMLRHQASTSCNTCQYHSFPGRIPCFTDMLVAFLQAIKSMQPVHSVPTHPHSFFTPMIYQNTRKNEKQNS
uniref:Uncharacterized protein n=1 Tax=Rhizophora mucronata TaxID=61149 RepID=A0A2P2JE39_RHIMU